VVKRLTKNRNPCVTFINDLAMQVFEAMGPARAQAPQGSRRFCFLAFRQNSRTVIHGVHPAFRDAGD